MNTATYEVKNAANQVHGTSHRVVVGTCYAPTTKTIFVYRKKSAKHIRCFKIGLYVDQFFRVTVCKTIRHMLSDRCLSCLFR